MFESVEEVQQRFRDARYIASRRVSTVVFLAARMGRPVLIEGPAGVGKTELAKTLSEVTARPLIRLQCYEGLDEGKALYEWKYAKQLLYTAASPRAHRRADRRRALAARRGGADRRARRTRSSRSASSRRGRSSRRSWPRAGRAAGRRDRQGRAGVRGVPARGALGFPGVGPRARERCEPGTSRSSC